MHLFKNHLMTWTKSESSLVFIKIKLLIGNGFGREGATVFAQYTPYKSNCTSAQSIGSSPLLSTVEPVDSQIPPTLWVSVITLQKTAVVIKAVFDAQFLLECTHPD